MEIIGVDASINDCALICGRPSQNLYLKGKTMNSLDKVKVYDRAMSFDEV